MAELAVVMAGIAKRLLMPPAVLFLVAAVGLALHRRRPRTARVLTVGSMLVLLVLCLPWTASALMRGLQDQAWVRPGKLPRDVQAIVVLGADVQGYTPELGRPDVGPMTVTRLRYAAQLARESGLPLAVSGGPTVAGVPPIATLMARVLREEQGLEARFVEDASLTTWQNAQYTAPLLLEAGIERILLVSHAWHLPRAEQAFEREGLEVIPAPTAALGRPDGFWSGCLPSASALRSSCFAVHEWLGRGWYRLRELLGARAR